MSEIKYRLQKTQTLAGTSYILYSCEPGAGYMDISPDSIMVKEVKEDQWSEENGITFVLLDKDFLVPAVDDWKPRFNEFGIQAVSKSRNEIQNVFLLRGGKIGESFSQSLINSKMFGRIGELNKTNIIEYMIKFYLNAPTMIATSTKEKPPEYKFNMYDLISVNDVSGVIVDQMPKIKDIDIHETYLSTQYCVRFSNNPHNEVYVNEDDMKFVKSECIDLIDSWQKVDDYNKSEKETKTEKLDESMNQDESIKWLVDNRHQYLYFIDEQYNEEVIKVLYNGEGFIQTIIESDGIGEINLGFNFGPFTFKKEWKILNK